MYETLTAGEMADMTTTELLHILETGRLTIPQIHAVKAELQARVI